MHHFCPWGVRIPVNESMRSCPQYRLLGGQHSRWHLEWAAFCLPLQGHRLLFPVNLTLFPFSDLLVSGSGSTCEAGHGNQGRRPVRPCHFGRLHSVSQLCRGKYRKICPALLWIFSSCPIFIQIVLWKRLCWHLWPLLKESSFSPHSNKYLLRNCCVPGPNIHLILRIFSLSYFAFLSLQLKRDSYRAFRISMGDEPLGLVIEYHWKKLFISLCLTGERIISHIILIPDIYW